MSAARTGKARQSRGGEVKRSRGSEDNKTEKIEEGRKFERRAEPEKQEIKQAARQADEDKGYLREEEEQEQRQGMRQKFCD